MPLSSGVFTRLYSWINDRNAFVNIDATRMDAEMDGMATALSSALYRDGQSTVTANIPLSGFRLTGVGDASAATDAVNRQTGDGRYVRQVGGGITPDALVSASTIDLSATGRSFHKTASGPLTWVFDNPAATGNLDGFVLILSNGGTGTQTWPNSVKWPNGQGPTLTTSGVDVLAFITIDAGTTWRGQLCQRNSS
jgi:hypothetical protein